MSVDEGLKKMVDNNITTSFSFNFTYANLPIIVISVFGITSNILLLIAFLKDPLKCFRNSGTYLVMNLSIADCLTSLSCSILERMGLFSLPLISICHTIVWICFSFVANYSACRRRGGVLKCPRFWGFFFGVESWAAALGLYRCTVYRLLSESMLTRLLNSISSRICRQNTQFNMYTTTSKQQEGCTFKDSHPKCFITTNFDKFHREAFARGGESR